MMGIQPSEFDRMPLWRYQAILFTWNERHQTGAEPTEAPDPAAFARSQQRIADKGLARTVH